MPTSPVHAPVQFICVVLNVLSMVKLLLPLLSVYEVCEVEDVPPVFGWVFVWMCGMWSGGRLAVVEAVNNSLGNTGQISRLCVLGYWHPPVLPTFPLLVLGRDKTLESVARCPSGASSCDARWHCV